MSFPSASPILPPTTGPLSVKKRKRDDTTHPADIDSRPFAVQSAGDDSFAKTTHFTPVCVLQRAHLPLAFLDVKGSGSRLFAAHVQVLELLHENGVQGNVLVAEQKEEARLYVVERAAKRVYVLCRLGEWITRDTLNRLSHIPKEPVRQVKRKPSDSASLSPWWAQAAVDTPEGLPHDSRPTSAMLRLAVQASIPIPKLLPDGAGLQDGKDVQHAALDSQGPDTQAADAGPQDPVEDLAKQYLDALYLSRTSLAYFAKGPLSRARSTLNDASPQSGDLVEFLRNSILPVNVMDKKYKESLTALIKDLSLASPSKDDKPAKSCRKKKFKPKRDKSGLFTYEADYLGQWWRGEEITGSMTAPENIDTALRRRLPALRMRETYLQIIIILETLYLEMQPAVGASTLASESQGAETQNAESQAVPETTKRKGKKALDLHSLLETLLDRLCIWQDLEADAPAKSLAERDAKNSEPSNELRDFCVEIIVPFFMSRLPKEAALVNKKLGGPSPPSPEKRKSTSSRSRPGEPAMRSRPDKQPRKPLGRVATETLNHAARPVPGLHRSATDSALIKREDSQPALSSIPPARPPVRASALSSYLSGHRQVDLAAKSAAASERLRKKKETEAQVQEAINNARKPNRPMATKEVAARADERFAQALNKNSRSSKSQRPAPPSVHVAATPKRSKPAFTNQFIPASTHSSNPSVIPSSSRRPNMAPRIDSTPAVPQTSHRETANVRRASGIEETPSRDNSSKFAFVSPSALRATPIKFQAALCESPTARRAPPSQVSVVAATPIKMPVGRKVNFGFAEIPKPATSRSLTDENATMKPPPPLVEATPVKGSSRGLLYGSDDDEDARYDDHVGGKSIYDVWNDDDDYEPLA
jgi:DNA replication regulator SLD3